jgi:hypothetical protein
MGRDVPPPSLSEAPVSQLLPCLPATLHIGLQKKVA